MKPCTQDRITRKGSYFCSDYSLGFIAGWGAHPLDIAIWGMDSDTKGPISFRGTGEFPTPKALFDTCATWDVEIKFSVPQNPGAKALPPECRVDEDVAPEHHLVHG